MPIDRRSFLQAAVATGVASSATVVHSDSAAAATPARREIIATEEGFNVPEVAAATRRLMPTRLAQEPGEAFVFGYTAPPSGGGPPAWMRTIADLDALRLADMDRSGISKQLLLLSSPGVQIFEAGEARELATLVNDRAADAIHRHPTRFAALAAIPPQDPTFAADELTRAVTKLGLSGAVINSHTRGEYLDLPKFEPILATAEKLDVPIYIHPRAPSPQTVTPYLDHGLVGAIWGYAVEVSVHALRLIFAGTFERFPKLRIVIGHMGEGIPFFLDRLDTHYAYGGGRGTGAQLPLKRKPSEYFLDRFVITTSGMNWEPSFRQAVAVMGIDRVLFAADYPFENQDDAVQRITALRLSPSDRAKFEHGNAKRVFKLT